MKHFIVMEVADEYNDEVYSLQEGGTPVAVFTTKEEADALRNKKQYERLRGLEVGQWAYDLEDLTRDPEAGWNAKQMDIEDIKEALPFVDIEEYETTLPDDMTDEQCAQVDAVFKGLSFFTVVEVDN